MTRLLKEPSVIFFDLGKVLVDYDFGLAYNYIKKRSALPSDEYDQRIPKVEELNELYETGTIGTGDFLQGMADLLEFGGSIDSLKLAWSDIFKPIPESIDLVSRLARTHALAIISNTSDAHIQLLEANYSFFSHFKERVYSHLIGSRKPDSKIYGHAMKIMGAKAENSLFIDDRIENIHAAADLGWATIHFHDGADLRQALIEAGVGIPSKEPR